MLHARLIEGLAGFPETLAAALRGVGSADAAWKPPEGAWSILEVVCHIADEEVEDFRRRLESTLRDPQVAWPPIAPEQWAVDRRYNEADLDATLARFTEARRASVAWLARLRDPDWSAAYRHPRAGAVHAGDLLASWAAHDWLHLRQIAKRRYQLAVRDAGEYSPAYAGALDGLNMRDRSTPASRLPLRCRTPAPWAAQALAAPLALLNDHAHLERKAATTALELLHRWPDPSPPENWVQAMTTLARDEVEHLAVVTRLLARRGGRLTRNHGSPYARDLRRLVRLGRGTDELVDRLLIAGLIEARSSERFDMLARATDDPELAELFRELCAADFGHYRVYHDLACRVAPEQRVEARGDELAEAEAEIIRRQAPGPRIHSWPE